MPSFCCPAPASHVVCLLLALLVRFSYQQSCGEHAVCRGDRPLLSTGCCPVGAGLPCQPANGDLCDTEIGFSCVDQNGDTVVDGTGICRGRYNLRSTSRGETVVDLVWTAFTPPDYRYEYVVLYREGTYHNDILEWTAREIGDQPSYSLTRLKPSTLYWIKVAIWKDARSLGNTTETIMVKTRPVEFCVHQDGHYLVGEPFVHDCEDNCTCLPTGQFSCVPLCPERGIPELEEGCHQKSGDECCDNKIICPVGGEPCQLNGITYPHGAEVENGCRFCTCLHGLLECKYPPECHEMEPSITCPNPKSRDVPGECCPEWYCDSTCVYENRTYNHHEYFTSTHCGLCQCDTATGVQCAPDCPPVVMVLPDAACPDPHVRQDGCCDTLYCYDPSLNHARFISRMFALSYSPVTLTLSFEVEPPEEENGVPLYCLYEISYTITSHPPISWQRRLVQLVDVSISQDQSHNVEPTEALTQDNAIVVGDRAYVTLSGMHPNTTYYVKINPLETNQEDMAGLDKLNFIESNVSAMVVVKTKPLNNDTSCFHEGREILHGQRIPSECNKVCFCHLGNIVCHSACEAETVVLATSPSCPQPRLEKKEGECCPQWKCYPSSTGCRHKGLIMVSGQSVTEACQTCICFNTSVHCSTVCPPVGESPRPGCELVNISGHCCQQWKCPLESHLPQGVKSSVLLNFRGKCEKPITSFTEDLKKQVLRHVTRVMGCTEGQSDFSNFCNDLHVSASCNGFSNNSLSRRKKREAVVDDTNPSIPVVVTVQGNFSSHSPDQFTVQTVESAGRHLMLVLNSSFEVRLDSGGVLTSYDKAQLRGPTFVCGQGFSYVKGSCVLSEIESNLSFTPKLQLKTTGITTTSATLIWSFLGDHVIKQLTGLLVEHRKDGDVQWLSSSRLDPTVTSHPLTSLASGQTFSVRLVALTPWSGRGRWIIGEVKFRTRPVALSAPSAFPLRRVTVSDTTAFLYWDRLPTDIEAQIIAINVSYKQIQMDHYIQKQLLPGNSQTHVQLKALQPDTAYIALVELFQSSGIIMTSHHVHFVTKPARESSKALKIAVVVSCAICVVVVILVLTYLLWRRSKRKGDNSGFENKTYGIQLENNNVEVQVAPTANPASD